MSVHATASWRASSSSSAPGAPTTADASTRARVEADLGEPPAEVERVQLGDGDAGGVGGDERLRRTVRRGARDEEPRRGVDVLHGASWRRSARGRRRRSRGRRRRRPAGRPPLLATAHEAEASPDSSGRQHRGLHLVAAGHGPGRRRPRWCRRTSPAAAGRPAAVGDQRRVEHAVARHAAAAERLRHEHREPAQLGRLPAVRRGEARRPSTRRRAPPAAGTSSSMNRVETSSSARWSSVASVSTRPPLCHPGGVTPR